MELVREKILLGVSFYINLDKFEFTLHVNKSTQKCQGSDCLQK